MKPILYISGPYSADSLIDRQQNILNAKRRFVAALATGEWWAVCPHTHTAELEMHLPDVDHDEWLKMDIAMLANCDAIWISGTDYYNYLSNGVRLELTWASLAKMPIYITYFTPSITDKPIKMLDSWDVPASYVALINDGVSRGEIPDPKTYKGSVLK